MNNQIKGFTEKLKSKLTKFNNVEITIAPVDKIEVILTITTDEIESVFRLAQNLSYVSSDGSISFIDNFHRYVETDFEINNIVEELQERIFYPCLRKWEQEESI